MNWAKGALFSIGIWMLSGCGEPIEDYRIIRTSSGVEMKVQTMTPVTLSTEETALLLKYYTDQNLEDRAAVREEVEKVWRDFRANVDQQGLAVAIIQPNTLKRKGWGLIGEDSLFVFRRTKGAWVAEEDPSITIK